MTSTPADQVRLSVAAAARRLGVAPATLRTWDRRYGLGPTERRAGQHRQYSGADLRRLEVMRSLLLQGVGAGEAARVAAASAPGPAGEASSTLPAVTAAGRPPAAGVGAGHLREAVARLDTDRLLALLEQAVAGRGAVPVWEELLRPELVTLGERWAAENACIAEEHLLSECAIRVYHRSMQATPATTRRPVLLLCAPGEAHVLPLYALAAALAECRVPTCLLGASTPHQAAVTAARGLRPAGVVVWAQVEATAQPEVFTGLPRIRGGCRWAAAGPGWAGVELPARVRRLAGLGEALDLLAT